MGRDLGMSDRDTLDLEYAALLHDIGQVALREPIPGGATMMAAPADQDRIAHDGAGIVRQTGVLDNVAVILESQSKPYRQVREFGEDLPLASRIIKVANAYDDLVGEARARRARKHARPSSGSTSVWATSTTHASSRRSSASSTVARQADAVRHGVAPATTVVGCWGGRPAKVRSGIRAHESGGPRISREPPPRWCGAVRCLRGAGLHVDAGLQVLLDPGVTLVGEEVALDGLVDAGA